MRRKICSIGNSQGVSIPVDVLDELNLEVGSEVTLQLDSKRSCIILDPVLKTTKFPRGINKEVVGQVNEFIKKYEPALKELAKK